MPPDKENWLFSAIPSAGYARGNVVWCLNLVNTMKQQMTEQKFYDFLSQIIKHRGRKNYAA